MTDEEIERMEAEEKDKNCVLFFSDYEKLEKDYNELKARSEGLEKENAELKEKLNAWENGSPIRELETEISELKKDNEYLDKVNNEQTEVILKLNEQIEKMKKFCDCEYCINVTSGDEFTVENTNKTLCEYCMENNKKLWELAE